MLMMGRSPAGFLPPCVSDVSRIDLPQFQLVVKAMMKNLKLRIIAIVTAVTIPLLTCFFLAGCRSLKREAWEIAPLKENEIEQVRIADQATMSIDRVRFFSREMQEPRFFLVLAPKTSRPPDMVFILNHGWSDRPETMLAALKLDQVYASLLAGGRVHPALLVLPDVRFPDYFRRNSNLFPFPQYLNLVAEEVSRMVSLKYNVPFSRDKWAIGGFSFGGYLSIDVGRRYGGRFSSISAVSTFFDEEWAFWPASPPPPGKLDSQGRGKQTLVEPGPIPRLFLACGTSDPFYGIMTQLHQKFQTLGINHAWSTGPGGHTWNYWSTVLEGMFLFHLGQGPNQS
jgi:enterochelin esterase-like enzyme